MYIEHTCLKDTIHILVAGRPPEHQIETLINMIDTLSAVKPTHIPTAEVVDSLICAFSRCSSDAYDVLVSQLNKDTIKGVFPSVHEIRLHAGNAYRTFEAKMKTKRSLKHSTNDRESYRDKERAHVKTTRKPLTWNQKTTKGGPSKPNNLAARFPCSVCKATQGEENATIHFVKDCPLLKHIPRASSSTAMVTTRSPDFHQNGGNERAQAARTEGEVTLPDEQSDDELLEYIGLIVNTAGTTLETIRR